MSSNNNENINIEEKTIPIRKRIGNHKYLNIETKNTTDDSKNNLPNINKNFFEDLDDDDDDEDDNNNNNNHNSKINKKDSILKKYSKIYKKRKKFAEVLVLNKNNNIKKSFPLFKESDICIHDYDSKVNTTNVEEDISSDEAIINYGKNKVLFDLKESFDYIKEENLDSLINFERYEKYLKNPENLDLIKNLPDE